MKITTTIIIFLEKAFYELPKKSVFVKIIDDILQ